MLFASCALVKRHYFKGCQHLKMLLLHPQLTFSTPLRDKKKASPLCSFVFVSNFSSEPAGISRR